MFSSTIYTDSQQLDEFDRDYSIPVALMLSDVPFFLSLISDSTWILRGEHWKQLTVFQNLL